MIFTAKNDLMMKYISMLILVLSLAACNSKMEYDFSKVNTPDDLDALISQMLKDGVEIDTTAFYIDVEEKGMHYHGVPISQASFYGEKVILMTDTLDFSGKKLLEALEAKNGLTAPIDGYDKRIDFEWDDENIATVLTLNFINGENLVMLGDKDNASLDLTYKPVYNVPLANIHKKIQQFDEEPIYVLRFNPSRNKYNVKVNGVSVYVTEDYYYEKSINEYLITSDPATIEINLRPLDSDGRPRSTFMESANFEAFIIEKNSQMILAQIDRQSLAGKKSAEFTMSFNPQLPWYPKAWTDGVDLRSDPQLKQKVIAAYKKLGDAFLAKDQQAVSDMLYDRNFEYQQSYYDVGYNTAKENWETYLEIINLSYIYRITDNFEFDFSADGKFIFPYPTDDSMIIFTGKRYSNTLAFGFYQPKGSNELKIIR